MAHAKKSKLGTTMFEPMNFPKQMYCTEESTFDIVGTFRRPPPLFGAPHSDLSTPSDSAPGDFPPLPTTLVKPQLRTFKFSGSFSHTGYIVRNLIRTMKTCNNRRNLLEESPLFTICLLGTFCFIAKQVTSIENAAALVLNKCLAKLLICESLFL